VRSAQQRPTAQADLYGPGRQLARQILAQAIRAAAERKAAAPRGRARDLGRSVCWLAGRVLRKVAERGVDHKTARCYVTAAEGCAGRRSRDVDR